MRKSKKIYQLAIPGYNLERVHQNHGDNKTVDEVRRG